MLVFRLLLPVVLALVLPTSSIAAPPGAFVISVSASGLDPATAVVDTPHVGWVNRDTVAHTLTFETLTFQTIGCAFTLAPGESTLSAMGLPVKGCSFMSPRGPTFSFPVGQYVYRVDGFREPRMGRLAVRPATAELAPSQPKPKPKATKQRGKGSKKPKNPHCHTRRRR